MQQYFEKFCLLHVISVCMCGCVYVCVGVFVGVVVNAVKLFHHYAEIF